MSVGMWEDTTMVYFKPLLRLCCGETGEIYVNVDQVIVSRPEAET
jgi:hypothetical protein